MAPHRRVLGGHEEHHRWHEGHRHPPPGRVSSLGVGDSYAQSSLASRMFFATVIRHDGFGALPIWPWSAGSARPKTICSLSRSCASRSIAPFAPTGSRFRSRSTTFTSARRRRQAESLAAARDAAAWIVASSDRDAALSGTLRVLRIEVCRRVDQHTAHEEGPTQASSASSPQCGLEVRPPRGAWWRHRQRNGQ